MWYEIELQICDSIEAPHFYWLRSTVCFINILAFPAVFSISISVLFPTDGPFLLFRQYYLVSILFAVELEVWQSYCLLALYILSCEYRGSYWWGKTKREKERMKKMLHTSLYSSHYSHLQLIIFQWSSWVFGLWMTLIRQ